MHSKYLKSKNDNDYIERLIVAAFGVWPLFECIWVNLWPSVRLGGVWFAVYCLLGLAIASIAVSQTIKIGVYSGWLFFYAWIIVGIIDGSAYRLKAERDLLVYISLFFLCLCIKPNKKNKVVLIKVLFWCGLFVALTVLLDKSTKLFNETLIGIYTDSARKYKLGLSSTGGIIPSLGAAACFIVHGLAAFFSGIRAKKRSLHIGDIIILSVFVVSFVILQKRGFLISSGASAVLVWLIYALFTRKNGIVEININKFFAGVLIAVLFVFIALFLYKRVDFVQDAVESFGSKFSREDETLSGRTVLYKLAFDLYSKSPIRGIGWGMYRRHTTGIFSRSSVVTYEVHNVYLQVLCETGLIGITMYLFAILSSLFAALRNLLKRLSCADDIEETEAVTLGLFFQFFYLIYGASGNPLYDYPFIALYFIGLYLCL